MSDTASVSCYIHKIPSWKSTSSLDTGKPVFKVNQAAAIATWTGNELTLCNGRRKLLARITGSDPVALMCMLMLEYVIRISIKMFSHNVAQLIFCLIYMITDWKTTLCVCDIIICTKLITYCQFDLFKDIPLLTANRFCSRNYTRKVKGKQWPGIGATMPCKKMLPYWRG